MLCLEKVECSQLNIENIATKVDDINMLEKIETLTPLYLKRRGYDGVCPMMTNDF